MAVKKVVRRTAPKSPVTEMFGPPPAETSGPPKAKVIEYGDPVDITSRAKLHYGGKHGKSYPKGTKGCSVSLAPGISLNWVKDAINTGIVKTTQVGDLCEVEVMKMTTVRTGLGKTTTYERGDCVAKINRNVPIDAQLFAHQLRHSIISD